jgi:glyoxylase-like metal-dependent hydrolase (beta-lactamase superfamily II)
VPLVQENKTIKVSDHVYVIPDGRINLVPNIGIIVGSRATLIVDAGMGPKNGETVLRELNKVNKNTALYFTTTHFHPEHVTGGQAFPANTIVIRPAAQQDEIDRKQPEFIRNFSKRTPEMKALLQDVKPRRPDIVFDREAEIDLGGVTVRLLWLGPAHTKGDNFVYVEEDGVLFTGDAASFPMRTRAEKTGCPSWISSMKFGRARLFPGMAKLATPLSSARNAPTSSHCNREWWSLKPRESLPMKPPSCSPWNFARSIRIGRILAGSAMR